MYNLLKNLVKVLKQNPDIDLIDALSNGQINSKKWLIDELSNISSDIGMTFILGGWYGILAAMMLESEKFDNIKIRSFDKDKSCAPIADSMNNNPWVMNDWQFKASTADMYDLDYTNTEHTTYRVDGSYAEMVEQPDTIINTSCEHLEDFGRWWSLIPKGKLVVLQSNDYFDIPEHCNCVSSLGDFKSSINMTETLYSGTLPLEKYNRFMIIGIK